MTKKINSDQQKASIIPNDFLEAADYKYRTEGVSYEYSLYEYAQKYKKISDVKKHELHRFELNDNEIVSNDYLLNSYGANIIDIGQILFKMEGNIGERAKDEIENLLNSNSEKDIAKIKKLLEEVGPGEYRWRLRAKLLELKKQS